LSRAGGFSFHLANGAAHVRKYRLSGNRSTFQNRVAILEEASERIFEDLHRFFQDDAEQISLYQDQLKDRYAMAWT
jgi:hypothetical protein